ncbi:MAG: NAD-dependent epimerase/dehydratase family protein [Christensenellales bacterium]
MDKEIKSSYAEQIIREDAVHAANFATVDWEKLRGTSILVTGATGLIGSILVKTLLQRNHMYRDDIQVYALARNPDKFERVFATYLNDPHLNALYQDIVDFQPGELKVDYIIHGASVTASRDFVKKPVTTIRTALIGSMNILEFAKKSKAKGMVYLSSMEVYGMQDEPPKRPLKEEDLGSLNILEVRNCYPESKRMVENMCVSYASETGIPMSIARLAQTFGAGVGYDDNRVFAYFARCVIEGKDIELLTSGESERMYVYTADAVCAILLLLTNGSLGAYNVANPSTYSSIKEMAQLVLSFSENKHTKLVFKTTSINKGFLPTHHLRLDVSKLLALGWKPKFSLPVMYQRLIEYMEHFAPKARRN